jgi:hypothetical protein
MILEEERSSRIRGIRGREWGGEEEIAALATCVRTSIRVHDVGRSGEHTYRSGGSFSAPSPLHCLLCRLLVTSIANMLPTSRRAPFAAPRAASPARWFICGAVLPSHTLLVPLATQLPRGAHATKVCFTQLRCVPCIYTRNEEVTLVSGDLEAGGHYDLLVDWCGRVGAPRESGGACGLSARAARP